MTDEEIRNLPAIIGIKEVMAILNIGRDKAYKLVEKDDFPKLPLGKPYRFSKYEILEWAKIK